MHYLLDEDKTALLLRMWDWLTPGGRVVISDMMLGRSLDRHHRQVLADKASAMLRRGPSGWWRLLKNIVRIGSEDVPSLVELRWRSEVNSMRRLRQFRGSRPSCLGERGGAGR